MGVSKTIENRSVDLPVQAVLWPTRGSVARQALEAHSSDKVVLLRILHPIEQSVRQSRGPERPRETSASVPLPRLGGSANSPRKPACKGSRPWSSTMIDRNHSSPPSGQRATLAGLHSGTFPLQELNAKGNPWGHLPRSIAEKSLWPPYDTPRELLRQSLRPYSVSENSQRASRSP